MNYLFYDIETTGLNKCFDQVLQFAAIRTDEKLNELSREEIHIKLNADIIPSPYAVITHRIPISDYQKGLSEIEAIKKIHTLMNTPNTISVGYNSLGFDDEFLRFSFYRNLFTPYTHQYANQCARMDLYPMALLYYLFKKDMMNWPEGNLKLENINACNHFFKGQSHNAMVDVEITLALARKLFQDQVMWNFVSRYFQKNTDEKRIADDRIGFLVNGKMGAASNYIAPVLYLGPHLHYKNQVLWLRLDDPELQNVTPENLVKKTKCVKKKLGEPPIFLPNKERYLTLLSDNRKKIFSNNVAWIENHPDILKLISNYYQHDKYPDVPERDIDAALYSIDFATSFEEKLFAQFHQASPEKKLSIAKQIPNEIRKAQALRILGRHYFDMLPEKYQIEFKNHCEKEAVDFRGEKKLTREQALLDIAALEKKTLDDEQKALLKEFQKSL